MVGRIYRKWRADREYARITAEMRAEWRIVDTGYETLPNGQIIAGYVLEQNALGERRFRVISQPHKGYQFSSGKYHQSMMWVACATPHLLPKKETV